MELSDLEGKKIAILGLGLENIHLAGFLLENEVVNIELRDNKSQAELLNDLDDELKDDFNKLIDKNLPVVFGDNYLNGLEGFDVVFRTPGIPYLTPEIQKAKKSGVIISSQIKLFFDLCPAKIIGVTGTKGKGTTAKLIKSILLQSGDHHRSISQIVTDNDKNDEAIEQCNNVYLLGNIGEAAVDKLEKITKYDIVILELSSFQLQDLEKSPHIAIITNLGEDHLNYHQNINEYWGAKANILRSQKKSDYAIINQDYLSAVELATETAGQVYYFSAKNRVDQGAYVRQIKNKKEKIKNIREVVIISDDQEEVVCRSDELNVVGEHNLENIAAASVVGKILNINIDDIEKAVKEFKGLEHRLEFVAEKNQVKYYNDSFATNPLSTIAAIKSFEQPIHLIVGGSEKGSDYSDLTDNIINSKTIKSVIYIGETGEIIKEKLRQQKFSGNLSPGGGKMEEMVRVAESFSHPGEIILLSPASASFGLFKNYKDRGDKFKHAVKKE